MNGTNNSEAQYLLRKLLTLETADLALRQPWLWEADRWKELVFAFLTRIVSKDEDQVRELTGKMNDLGLLDIATLARMSEDAKTFDSNNPDARHILEFFQENGLDPEKAQQALTTICEAAVGLQKYFDGKVQRYLRGYGEMMLREIARTFQFSALRETEVAFAFTYWLQNVLNMPLSLLDANVLAFCEQHHLTPEQLVAAADNLDLNLAVLDDLILRYVSRQGKGQPYSGEVTSTV